MCFDLPCVHTNQRLFGPGRNLSRSSILTYLLGHVRTPHHYVKLLPWALPSLSDLSSSFWFSQASPFHLLARNLGFIYLPQPVYVPCLYPHSEPNHGKTERERRKKGRLILSCWDLSSERKVPFPQNFSPVGPILTGVAVGLSGAWDTRAWERKKPNRQTRDSVPYPRVSGNPLQLPESEPAAFLWCLHCPTSLAWGQAGAAPKWTKSDKGKLSRRSLVLLVLTLFLSLSATVRFQSLPSAPHALRAHFTAAVSVRGRVGVLPPSYMQVGAYASM